MKSTWIFLNMELYGKWSDGKYSERLEWLGISTGGEKFELALRSSGGFCLIWKDIK